GFSLASNTITNTITAELDHSSLTSGGGLDLSALAEEQVVAVAAAGALAASVGTEAGLAFAGAGAGSVNGIRNPVTAHGPGGSRVTNHNGQPVSLTASDDSFITANAGAISVAIGGGSSGRDLALGASVAVNVITNDVSALVDGSTVDAGGDVALSAAEAATIL